ncbi:hypothetical protein [Brassicibacter mesophilus]
MSFRKLFFVLAIIVSLNIGTTVGLCIEPDYPEPWVVKPVEEQM